MPSTVGPSPPHISPTKTPASATKRKHEKHVSAKSARPTTLSRRNTPQCVGKLGASKRESQYEERKSMDSDSDSFLNYCTYCEKQINSSSSNFLYCSEICRQRDLQSTLASPRRSSYIQSQNPFHAPEQTHIHFSSSSRFPSSPPLSPFNTTFSSTDGPDIVPRASPTISRPRSYFGTSPSSHPIALDHPVYALPSSLPHSYSNKHSDERKRSSTALASLRELSSALEHSTRTSQDHGRRSRHSNASSNSSDELNVSPGSRSSSGVWSYMTMTSRKGSQASMSRTYTTPSPVMSEPRTPALSSAYSYGASRPVGTFGLASADRPLPPRTAGHRTQSVDLLTPLSTAK